MDNKLFSRLVLIGFVKHMTISIAGMIDCAVVGRSLGASGLSALKLVMPVYSMLSLFSTILGTGLAVTVSRDLSRDRKETADRTVHSVFTVTLFISALFMAAGRLFTGKLTAFLAGNHVDPVIFREASEYLSVILISALPILLYDILESLAILEGAASHGLPMVLKSVCGIVTPMAVNRIMLRYGTTAGLAALSVQNAVHYLPTALCSGVASEVLIMTGIYAGEQDEEGLRRVNVNAIRWSLAGGLLISLSLSAGAYRIMRLFTDDPEILSLSVTALRLYLIGVPFLSLNYTASSYLQGVGRNLESGIVIFVNHILVSISTALILARLYGTEGVFASYGVCEIIMCILLVINILFFFLIRRESIYIRRGKDNNELRMNIETVSDAVTDSQRVNAFCLENEIDPKTAHHISLCTEELAVNSIEHGFNDGKKHHLELRVFISKNRTLYLRLRDDCRRFDLKERYRIINPEDPTKNIGLRIVFANADEVQYSSALNLNNVCVRYVMPELQAG